MAVREQIPLFPLSAVLLCGGRLPLQIFEPRYLDLVGRCMKTDTGFGVVLIREGRETRIGGEDGPPSVFEIGTYAKILDFNPLANGRLGILCGGGSKFRIHRSWEAPDKLMMAEVEFLPAERASAIGEEFQPLVETLRVLVKHPMIQKLALDVDYQDASSVGWRLAELLPLEAETKQSLLQMQLARERLVEIRRLLAKLRG